MSFSHSSFRSLIPAVFLALLMGSAPVHADISFSAPEKITDGAAKYQLSRNPGAQAALDADGIFHAAYWSGVSQSTSPTNPSYIYYRTWDAIAGWGAATAIDDSETSGQHVGGRHPSLAIAPNGDIWVAWHDHRHCTNALGWVDNIEIYADKMPFGGSFSSTDIRLTTTSAAHAGDNGYTPRIVAHETGELSLAWYDFNDDYGISDIYIKKSDASGVFNLGETMTAMRSTDLDDRGGTPEYTLPDMAVDTSGTRHLVWITGTGAGGDMLYAEIPLGSTTATPTTLAVGAGDFFDPPKIALAPNGDVWIAYADQAAAGGEDVTLLRKPAGASAFDAPIVIADQNARQDAPDIAFAADGRAHLVWIDRRSGQHLYYGVYDPIDDELDVEYQVTDVSGSWVRPSLTLDAEEHPLILFGEDVSITAGEIWFTRELPPPAAATLDWTLLP